MIAWIIVLAIGCHDVTLFRYGIVIGAGFCKAKSNYTPYSTTLPLPHPNLKPDFPHNSRRSNDTRTNAIKTKTHHTFERAFC